MFDGLLLAAPWAALPLLLVGFLPLVKGADFLVDGGSALAKRFNIPTLAIGLTIVAFGTSMPELVVNMFAATGGSGDLALGNIIGSNIFNILGILGISALIMPLAVKSSTTWIEIPLTLLAAIVVTLFANDIIVDGSGTQAISRIDGFVLLCFFAIFLAYTINMGIKGDFDEGLTIKAWGISRSVFFILLGLGLLILGGKMIVDGAVAAARSLGIAERVIGLTIVSIGTSLPELATSAVAAFKKNTDIAVGNIVGSNIFNVFFILGLTAVINPVPVNASSNLDLLLHIGTTLLLMLFVFVPRKRTINRVEGAVFLAVYIAYVIYLIVVPSL